MGEQDFRVQKGIVVGDGNIQVNSTGTATVLSKVFDTDVAAAGVTLSGTTLAADGSDSNIDINLTPKGTGEVNISKVDIDAGTIDSVAINGGTIGTSTAVTDFRVDLMKLDGSTFSTVSGNTNINIAPHGTGGTTFGGTDKETNTAVQVNGRLVANGGNLGNGSASQDTLTYAELRVHTDIAEADIAKTIAPNMAGTLIVDNEDAHASFGQGTIYTVGRNDAAGADSWGIGRQATTGKFAIGYIAKDYDNVVSSTENPMMTGQALLELDTATAGGNLKLTTADATFSVVSNTNKVTSIKGHSSAADSITYQLPSDHPASTGYVLSSTTGGVMSWVAQSVGSITALNNHSGNENSLVTIGSTTTQLDAESTLTYNGQTLHINTATDNTPAQLLLEHSFNDTIGGNIMLRLDKGAAGAANDVLGGITWQGDDADQNLTNYAVIKGDVVAATGGSEEGRLTVRLAQTSDGALADMMILTGGDEADGTSSKVVIKGDLQVDGDTTTLNTTTLEVEDKEITIAKNATNNTEANASGIRVAGSDATLLYASSGDRWNLNKDTSIAGTLSADTSLTLDSTTITTAEIGVLDGVTAGTVTASKALVVDSNRHLTTIGNLTSDGAIRGATLSVDAVAIMDTATQSTNQSWSNSETKTLYTYVANTYRSVKLVGEISNGTDVDVFEALVTWKGTGSTPSASSDVHVTTYAYIASSGTPLGTLSAVKDTNNIDINFTIGGSGAGNYRWTITATQLVNNYAN